MFNTTNVIKENIRGFFYIVVPLALMLYGCHEPQPKVKVGFGTAYKPTGKTK